MHKFKTCQQLSWGTGVAVQPIIQQFLFFLFFFSLFFSFLKKISLPATALGAELDD
jgi:hypothetical protein